MATKSFSNFKADVDKLTEEILYETAEAVVSYIDSSDIIPIQTHNLKDSTGVGVYRNGVLKRFVMPRRAEVARIVDGVAVWGEDIIGLMLEAGINRYSQGDYIVIMSAMPYADAVDKSYRNSGFFTDILSTELEVQLHEIVKLYRAKMK